MQNEYFMIIISNMAPQIPIYLVWLTGIILAIDSRKRNPRSSLYAILATVLMFVLSLIGNLMSILPMQMHKQGSSILNISMMTSYIRFGMSFLSAGAWGLLLAAIFGERCKSPNCSH
jgi:hypothetical protein